MMGQSTVISSGMAKPWPAGTSRQAVRDSDIDAHTARFPQQCSRSGRAKPSACPCQARPRRRGRGPPTRTVPVELRKTTRADDLQSRCRSTSEASKPKPCHNYASIPP